MRKAEVGQSNKYMTIPQCAKVFPFSAAALRDIRFKAFDRKNSRGEAIAGNGTGAAGVWIELGRKLLIDTDAFAQWIDSHKVTA